MNVISRIQVGFGEPAIPRQIPVRTVLAAASLLPGITWVNSPAEPRRITRDAGSSRQPAETDQLIARIRKVLQKQGT
ncbi:MAG: hypothetical protein WAO02_15980 [Verrucomicrobiia bacterium]